jgi:hypothetical protein
MSVPAITTSSVSTSEELAKSAQVVSDQANKNFTTAFSSMQAPPSSVFGTPAGTIPAQLSGSPGTSSQITNLDAPESAPVPPKKKNSNLVWWIIGVLAAILVLGVIIFLAVYFGRQSCS